jgi:hypothetical protein
MKTDTIIVSLITLAMSIYLIIAFYRSHKAFKKREKQFEGNKE